MKIEELAVKLGEWIGDRTRLFWSFEEARSLGYTSLKLQTLRDHELSLILNILDHDSGEVKVAGVRLLVDKSKIESVAIEKLKKLLDEIACKGKTSYAESSIYLQFLFRSDSLEECLNVIKMLLRYFGELNISNNSEGRFIGYSFFEEEIQ